MSKKTLIIAFASMTLFLTSLFTQATTLHGMKFEPTHKAASGEELVLNGVGLRKVKRFGLSFKVYVAGLYLKAKTKEGAAIISSQDPAFLQLKFLRKVSKKDLANAWKESLRKTCKENCEEAKEGVKQFNSIMVDVKKGSSMDIAFTGTTSVVNIDGREKKSTTINGASFRKNLLNIFVGPEPPNKELKAGLLGN